jgi:hypothetical protein
MRAGRLALLLTTLVLPVVAPGPANAQDATSATCAIFSPAYFSPGFSMTTGSGHYESRGETGTINSIGAIDGRRVTGAGTFGFDGTYTDANCLTNRGTGTYFFTIPTDAGSLHVSGTFVETRFGLGGPVDARSPFGFFQSCPPWGTASSLQSRKV